MRRELNRALSLSPFDSLLFMWTTMRTLYSEMGRILPIEGDHEVLLELYALMSPFAQLILKLKQGHFLAPHSVWRLWHICVARS